MIINIFIILYIDSGWFKLEFYIFCRVGELVMWVESVKSGLYDWGRCGKLCVCFLLVWYVLKKC